MFEHTALSENRMAKENLSWGYTRLQGALKNLGLKVSRGTVANVLKENGMEGAPEPTC